MNSKDIAYTARVSAAVWMIRKARKIASLLSDRMPDEQQAIEEEIVEIGMALYRGAEQQPQPETTHDPGEDHELEAYVSAVREMVPDAPRKFLETCREYGFSPGAAAAHYRNW